MNLERAAMKGELVELKEKRTRLRNGIKGDAEAIRQKLNTVRIQPDDLEIDVIDVQFDQLKLAWAELLTTNTIIAAYERELD